MQRRWLIVALLVFPLSAFARSVLVLGDSISAAYGMPRESGWVTLLAEQLDREYPGQFQVVNASVSGETTAGGLFRLPTLLAKDNVRLLVVELGGNDGLRGMALSEMERNLSAIVRLGRDEGAKILLISVELPASYGLHFQRRYAEVFRRLAEDEAVAHLPLGFGMLKDRSLLQEDGIHPTEAAQPLLLAAIWPEIRNALEAAGGKR